MAWNKNYNNDEGEDKVSKFNAAGLINSTIENLWKEVHTAMANGEYSKWNIKLDSVWTILGGDIKEGSDEDKQYSKLSLELYNTGSLMSQVNEGFSKQKNPNNSLQYQILMKKSLFLRRLQNKQGKGTAYANEDEDDFD